MKLQNNSMTEGPILKNMIFFTVPVILTSLLQLLFNAADLVVVGRYCGSLSVAAIGSTGAITNLIVNLFMGLSVGAGVTVAHMLGSQNDQGVHQTIHTAIPAALVSGLILTVIGIPLTRPMLRWMDTPDTVLGLSATYMEIYFGGIIFTMVYNFCSAILRAAGDSKSPLIYLTLAGVVNVILNLIFVIVFHMNVEGVAFATVISQAVAAVLVVIALMRRTDACKFYPRKMKFYKRPFLKMVQIGLPAGIQGSLFSISNVMIQSSVNSFGDVFMSGNAAAANIEGFVYCMLNAHQQTALTFIGQNTGARKFDRARKILWMCLASVTVVGLTAGSIAYFSAPKLLAIYIPDAPSAIQYGITRMAFISLPYFLCGLMDVTTGALRGMGSSIAPMVVSVIGICVLRIVWIKTIFQIPSLHTPECLYVTYPISWIVTLAAQLVIFFKVYKRLTRQVELPTEYTKA